MDALAVARRIESTAKTFMETGEGTGFSSE
jgi:hypothetical protein